LDVGAGVGGPARLLAATFGCRVTGIDATADFLEAARLLTRLTGLQDRVEFVHGDAAALPFDDATFDLVWTQAVQPNIAGKERFFAEVYRVLRPGRRCAVHDLWCTGEPSFPAYWARDRSGSFLATQDELQ